MPDAGLSASGIGMRAPHYAEIVATRPAVGFLEGHSENYFCIGGVPFERLMQCRALYPVSLHGVGLSLGSAEGVDAPHLAKLKTLVDIVDPLFVSEHVSWSGHGGIAVPDLLPLPMTGEALDVICGNVARVQDALGRKILVENPSSYLAFNMAEMGEPEFLAEICARTGCGLLLDVNNIHVSAHNTGFDARDYLRRIPKGIVEEIHLAGYQVSAGAEGEVEIFVDAHNHAVYPAVWDLYAEALEHLGDVPTLIEWDTGIPPLAELLAEAKKADDIRAKHQKQETARAG